MFNSYNKQSAELEKFRIKAHLRSYVKDPITVDETLLKQAVIKLKKLPYTATDPADSIAIELLRNSYHLGYFRYEDLTDNGRKLVRHSKYRRQHRIINETAHHAPVYRNRLSLKTI